MRFAIPSSYGTFTHYLSPVLTGAPRADPASFLFNGTADNHLKCPLNNPLERLACHRPINNIHAKGEVGLGKSVFQRGKYPRVDWHITHDSQIEVGKRLSSPPNSGAEGANCSGGDVKFENAAHLGQIFRCKIKHDGT